jgi:putative salt-induced outer membrane protein YdiY
VKSYHFLVFSCLLYSISWVSYAQIALPDSLKKQVEQYILQKADSIVQAKIDSIQQKQNPPKPKPRIFKYDLSLTGSLNAGNVDRKLLAFRSEFKWTGKLVELDVHPRFAFGEQNKQLAENEPYIDAMLNFFHQKKVYAFAMTNMEASNLRGINFRWLGGVGVGWHIIRQEKVKLSITNLLLHEGTDFRDETAPDIILWRNSTRLKGQYNILKRLTFKHWLYFQPSFTAQNFRWNGIFSLEFPIYKNLQFRINFEDVYESVVPEGRKNADRFLTLGLALGRK